jgi:hypothetical protein
MPLLRMWVHCPRASNGPLPRRSNLVGYVRRDARSDRFPPCQTIIPTAFRSQSVLPTNRPESLLSAKPPRPYHIARIVVLKTEDQRIQDSHSRPHPRFSTCFLRGSDKYRPIIAGTCRPRPAPAVSPGGVSASATSASPRMRLPSRLLLLNHQPLWVKRYVLCLVTARQSWPVAVFGTPSYGL